MAGKPAWIDEPIVHDPLSGGEITRLADAFRRVAAPASGERPAAVAKRRDAERRGSDAGTRHRHRRRDRRRYFGLASLIELELMVKAGLTPAQAIVAGDPHVGGDPATRGARHDRGRASPRLPRARRESARRHRQHSADLVGLPAGRRSQRAPRRYNETLKLASGRLHGAPLDKPTTFGLGEIQYTVGERDRCGQ